jgi:hypothetical protein
MDAGGADQGQRVEALRVADRKLGRDPAADRESDEIDVLKIELIEDVEIEVGEVGDVVEPVGVSDAPKPGCSGTITSWRVARSAM